MSAYSLPSHLVDATVTAVDAESDPRNVVVWIRLDDDAQPIGVTFERDTEHLDPAVLEVVEGLEPGDAVEVGYTSIGEGAATINLGRSVSRPNDDTQG